MHHRNHCLLLIICVFFLLSTTGAFADDWSPCSEEGGICQFSGERIVRYGADGQFQYKVRKSSTACENSVFDDPIPGTRKACHVRPLPRAWAACAPEGGSCTVQGPHVVRYGANGHYRHMIAQGRIECTNSSQGGDPIEGTQKSCGYSLVEKPTTTWQVTIGTDGHITSDGVGGATKRTGASVFIIDIKYDDISGATHQWRTVALSWEVKAEEAELHPGTFGNATNPDTSHGWSRTFTWTGNRITQVRFEHPTVPPPDFDWVGFKLGLNRTAAGDAGTMKSQWTSDPDF